MDATAAACLRFDLVPFARERLGVEQVKPEQLEVVAALARGESVVALLPTGFGKSFCYQLPAVAWKWRVVVVQPLLALIADQKARAEALGLRVVDYHSRLTRVEKRQAELRLGKGDWDLLLLSPERLWLWWRQGRWAGIRRQSSLLVLDEAHCFVDWRAFRPAYAHLDAVLQDPDSRRLRILALSATLPPDALELLARRWQRPFIGIRGGLGRENLCLAVEACGSQGERLTRLCGSLRGMAGRAAAIVYCGTRGESDAVATFLRAAGWSARAFHAGQSLFTKAHILRAVRTGGLQVVCATTAFGMGIDCAEIERVVHWGPPLDLISYWQEVGRAGRSGAPAFATLLWNRSDALRLRQRFRESPIADRDWRARNARALIEFLHSRECRKRFLARHLGWECGDCDNCDRCRASARKNPWWIDDRLHALYGEWPELKTIRKSEAARR